MKKASRPKSDYSIQTVSNALRLLESFREEGELGVSELSRTLDLHKNNVFRLLATLEESGYIEQCSSSERYRLGVRCLELGRSFARGRTLLSSSRPILEELARTTGESTHLAVLRGFEVVHLDGESPRHLVASAVRVGMRLPVHCTALGKVLLACGDESGLQDFDREIVVPSGLEARTPRTIQDREKFIEELRGVAVQGCAFDIEECESGLLCVAAPVMDDSARVMAAVSVSAPAHRVDEETLRGSLCTQVIEAAQRVSQIMGHPG